MNTIRSRCSEIFTERIKKVALNKEDYKKIIQEDEINAYQSQTQRRGLLKGLERDWKGLKGFREVLVVLVIFH